MVERLPKAGHSSPDEIARAVQVLREGGVIAIPTDTVYGLAAALDHPQAIVRIFEIKGRDETKALPVLVSSTDMLSRLTRTMSDVARRLADAFWPGALTLVVKATDNVPEVVRRGGPTVGLRMPDNSIAQAIIAGAGGALAVTSANRSGQPEARSAEDVRGILGSEVDTVVDGGPSPLAFPSTVIDVSGERVRILRTGAISVERLRQVVGDVE